MTETQYRRANRTVFPAVIIILAYVSITLLAFVSSGKGVTIRTYVQLAAAVLGIAVCIGLYVVKRDTKLCAYGILASAVFVYGILRTVGTREDNFSYIFPVLFAAVTYLNLRLIVIGNGII